MRHAPTRIAEALGIAWLLANTGCGELPRFAWELDEAPRALLIRVDVVEDGPLAEGIGGVEPGRRRAEILPGDVVELDALIATGEGRIDPEATNAFWFFCDGGCPVRSLDEVPSCEEVVALDPRICLAGRGSPRLVVPGRIGAPDSNDTRLWANVVVISGRTAEETETCFARLRSAPDASLQGCAIGIRALVYGPAWRVLEESFAQLETSEEPDLPDVPIDLARLVSPNTAPVIRRLFVLVDGEDEGATHEIDAPIRVPAGASITIEAVADPIDQEFQIVPVPSVPNAFTALFDSFEIEIFTDHESDASVIQPYISLAVPVESLVMEMPPHEATIGMWILVSDSRGARSWTRARFEVVAP